MPEKEKEETADRQSRQRAFRRSVEREEGKEHQARLPPPDEREKVKDD